MIKKNNAVFSPISGYVHINQQLKEIEVVKKYLKEMKNILADLPTNDLYTIKDLYIAFEIHMKHLKKNKKDMEILRERCIQLAQNEEEMISHLKSLTVAYTQVFEEVMEEFKIIKKEVPSEEECLTEDYNFLCLKLKELNSAMGKHRQKFDRAELDLWAYKKNIKEITKLLSEIENFKTHFVIEIEKKVAEKHEGKERPFFYPIHINLKRLFGKIYIFLKKIMDHLKKNS